MPSAARLDHENPRGAHGVSLIAVLSDCTIETRGISERLVCRKVRNLLSRNKIMKKGIPSMIVVVT